MRRLAGDAGRVSHLTEIHPNLHRLQRLPLRRRQILHINQHPVGRLRGWFFRRLASGVWLVVFSFIESLPFWLKKRLTQRDSAKQVLLPCRSR